MSGRLFFSALHTWARAEDEGLVSIGITAHAQHELGELQYVGLPRAGATVRKDEAFGEVESVKTACDVYAPCTGVVTAVNTELADAPFAINRDPYGAGWMMRVRPSDPDEFESLLDEATYLGLSEPL
jgi:glycine cleavage system H protein